MKPMLTTLVLGMSLSFGMPAFASGDHSHSHDGTANTSTMPAMNIAMSDGQVKKVDKSQGKVTLKHGPIENMGMPGMTMVFRVKDAGMLDRIKPGDNVRFHAEKMDGAMMVTKLEMAK